MSMSTGTGTGTGTGTVAAQRERGVCHKKCDDHTSASLSRPPRHLFSFFRFYRHELLKHASRTRTTYGPPRSVRSLEAILVQIDDVTRLVQCVPLACEPHRVVTCSPTVLQSYSLQSTVYSLTVLQSYSPTLLVTGYWLLVTGYWVGTRAMCIESDA